MSNELFSGSVKSGRGTVFVDLKVAKNGKEYLSISESAYVDDNGTRKRTTIRIFGDAVNSFKACIADVPEVVSRELTKEEAERADARRKEFEHDKAAAKEVEDAKPKAKINKY